jgi:hypothetical protein
MVGSSSSGADVGHPAPGLKNQPSVANLIWSYDRFAAQYEAVMYIWLDARHLSSLIHDGSRVGYWLLPLLPRPSSQLPSTTLPSSYITFEVPTQTPLPTLLQPAKQPVMPWVS